MGVATVENSVELPKKRKKKTKNKTTQQFHSGYIAKKNKNTD